METYAILLTEETRFAVPELAMELGRILDRPVAEVSRRLRESPWILTEGVPASMLDPIFEALSAAGVKAKAVPEVHMPLLPGALRVRTADLIPKGLFLTAAEPPAPPFLPWEALWIVSGGNVAVMPDEVHRLAVGDDIGGALGPTPGSMPISAGKKKAQEHLLVDFLFRDDGREWHLRIDGGDFSYDFLKEEMRPSSRENLKAVLLRIRDRAPRALFTERTLAFLAGEPSARYRFRSLAAFRTHNRWIRQAAGEAEEEA